MGSSTDCGWTWGSYCWTRFDEFGDFLFDGGDTRLTVRPSSPLSSSSPLPTESNSSKDASYLRKEADFVHKVDIFDDVAICVLVIEQEGA